MASRDSIDLEVLGASVGTDAGASSILTTRREKGQRLLHQLAEVPDAQLALPLLRHCGLWARTAFCARTTPPHQHKAVLKL
eukprot:7044498-Prorocentrum_lima.AAC.1